MIDKILILKYFLQTAFSRLPANREDLALWQSERFSKFARQTLSQSPFYKKFGDSCLTDFPVINKAIWVDNFNAINTKQLNGKALFEMALASEESRDFNVTSTDIAAGLSSGTSGKRALFVTDKNERAQYAGFILARCLGKHVLKKQRVALLLRANNKLYESIGGSHIKFKYFDLKRPWREILVELQAFQPTVVVGPPQVLSMLAQAQDGGAIKICPAKIISGAEVLEKKEQNHVESIFKVPVDQIYQATEGFLGVSCRYGTIHLNEDHLIVEKEWLNRETRRFVPVITDFSRTTQPLIRYRLNDVLVEKQSRCQCGSVFTAIEKIEGREDDILFLQSKDVVSRLVPVMPDFVRDAMALSIDTITDYRLVQQSFDRLQIAIDAPDLKRAKERTTENLQKLFGALNLKMPELIFVEKITTDMHVKLRRVTRLFPMTEVFEWNAS